MGNTKKTNKSKPPPKSPPKAPKASGAGSQDRLLDRLHQGGLTLLVEKGGLLVHASDRGGLRPLWDGVIEHPDLFEGSDVADRVIGLAAAYLLVHAHVARVSTPLIARDAERAFTEAGIPFTAVSRVKKLEDVPVGQGGGAQGVSIEQLAHDSVTPATFVEALRTRFG